MDEITNDVGLEFRKRLFPLHFWSPLAPLRLPFSIPPPRHSILAWLLLAASLILTPPPAAAAAALLERELISLPTPQGDMPVSILRVQDGKSGPLGQGWTLNLITWLESGPGDAVTLHWGERTVRLTREKPDDPYIGSGVEARFDGQTWTVVSSGKQSAYDALGREISRELPIGGTLSFAYDADGRLVKCQAVEGQGLQFSYGGGRLAAITASGSGMRCALSYGPDKRLVSAQNAWGGADRFAYDADGRLKKATRSTGDVESFEYDPQGRIIRRAITDGPAYAYEYGQGFVKTSRNDGYWWKTSFDAQGRPVSFEDSLGRKSGWTWDGERLARRSFPDGSRIDYAYDALGRVRSMSAGENAVFEVGYLGETSLPVTVNRYGKVTRFAYDASGNPISIVSPAGRPRYFERDALGRVTAEKDGEGRTVSFAYDDQGNLVRRLDPDGGEWLFSYDRAGRLLEEKAPGGMWKKYAYDDQGRLTREESPYGAISYAYDGRGLLAFESDGRSKLGYEYGGAGRLKAATLPGGFKETFTYDPLGTLTGIARSGETLFQASYDPLGRPVSVETPDGTRASLDYSASGTLKAIKADGRTLSIVRDESGRKIETQGDGVSAKLERDPSGLSETFVDPSGGKTTLFSDPDGLLLSLKLPDGAMWRYEYDGAGLLTRVRAPAGWNRRIKRDAAGRPSALTYPWGGETAVAASPGGETLDIINARGQRTSVKNGPGGEPLLENSPEGETRRVYDRGYLLETSRDGLKTRYDYDDLGRLVSVAHKGLIDAALGYDYDENGRVAALINPDDSRTSYGYDGFGRLTSLTAPGGRKFAMAYDPYGRLTRLSYPNGASMERELDAFGRITIVRHRDATGAPMAVFRYDRDAAGRLRQVERDGKAVTFDEDSRARIVRERGPGLDKEYDYDQDGGRIRMTDKGASTNLAYDAGGRLVSAGELTFAYDPDGNLVKRASPRGEASYAFDSSGRLVGAKTPDGETLYGYDAENRLFWREKDGKRAYKLYDGDNCILEMTAAGQALASYVYLDTDAPLLSIGPDGEATYYHQDAMGNVVALSDAKGRLKAAFTYDAFGVLTEGDAPKGPVRPLLYAARPYDEILGFYDFRARYYDPAMGRFISPDPRFGDIADPDSIPLYLFARNNPLLYSDPFGAEEAATGAARERLRIPNYDEWKKAQAGTASTHRPLFKPEASGPTKHPLFTNGGGGKTRQFPYSAVNNRETKGFTFKQDLDPRSLDIWWKHDRIRGNGLKPMEPPRNRPNIIVKTGKDRTGIFENPRPATHTPGGNQRTGVNYRPLFNDSANRPTNMTPAPTVQGADAATTGAATTLGQGASDGQAGADFMAQTSKVGALADLGNRMMEIGDVVGESSSAWIYGQTEESHQRCEEAVQNLQDSVMMGAGLWAGGTLAGLAAPSIAAALSAPVAFGGAVLGTAALAWGAGDRLGNAVAEGAALAEAGTRREGSEAAAERTTGAISENAGDLIGALRSNLQKLQSLRQELDALLRELRGLELEAANARNKGQAKDERARELEDKVKALRPRLEAVAATYAQSGTVLGAEEAASAADKVEGLAAQACALARSAPLSEEDMRKLRALAEQTSQAAERIPGSRGAAGEALADMSLDDALAEARQAQAEAQSIFEGVRSDQNAVSERVAVMEGAFERFKAKLAEAESVRKQIMHSANRLTMFDKTAEEAKNIREEAAPALPSGEADSLMAAARQSLSDIGENRATVVSGEADNAVDLAERLKKAVDSAQSGFDEAKERAARAAAQAEDCVKLADAGGTSPEDGQTGETDGGQASAPAEEGFSFGDSQLTESPHDQGAAGTSPDSSANAGSGEFGFGTGSVTQGGRNLFSSPQQFQGAGPGGASGTGTRSGASASRCAQLGAAIEAAGQRGDLNALRALLPESHLCNASDRVAAWIDAIEKQLRQAEAERRRYEEERRRRQRCDELKGQVKAVADAGNLDAVKAMLPQLRGCDYYEEVLVWLDKRLQQDRQRRRQQAVQAMNLFLGMMNSAMNQSGGGGTTQRQTQNPPRSNAGGSGSSGRRDCARIIAEAKSLAKQVNSWSCDKVNSNAIIDLSQKALNHMRSCKTVEAQHAIGRIIMSAQNRCSNL